MAHIKKKDFVYGTFSDLISEREFNEHIILYSNYINKTNDITERMLLQHNIAEYWAAKELETFNLNGVKLHELYFENIKETNSVVPAEVMNFFDRYFQDYKAWEMDFKDCCNIAKGWCIFGFEPHTSTFRNILLDTHNLGMISTFMPLIVMDVYEHAYWMDYGTSKSDYINKFISCINWDIVKKRADNI